MPSTIVALCRLGPLSRASPVSLRYWLVDNMVPALAAELDADTRSNAVSKCGRTLGGKAETGRSAFEQHPSTLTVYLVCLC